MAKTEKCTFQLWATGESVTCSKALDAFVRLTNDHPTIPSRVNISISGDELLIRTRSSPVDAVGQVIKIDIPQW